VKQLKEDNDKVGWIGVDEFQRDRGTLQLGWMQERRRGESAAGRKVLWANVAPSFRTGLSFSARLRRKRVIFWSERSCVIVMVGVAACW
jgi:hypothetical protein